MKQKRFIIGMILAALMLLCAGCDLGDRDSLFALPELSGEYAFLQQELNKVLADGATYTVAATGSVRSSVQMADLNGDGRDEAIGLFLSAEGVPEVHVFRLEKESCHWLGKLVGVGTGVREIRYFRRDDHGGQALAVSWNYESDARYHGMTVAGMGDGELFTMLDLQYSACLPQDLDGDRVEELTFVRPGRGTEAYSACVYRLIGDHYQLVAQDGLGTEVQSVLQMQYAKVIRDRVTLVVESGARNGGYVTDVLDFDGETMKNLTRDAVTGSGNTYWRQVAVPAYDINGDGLLELPMAQSGDAMGEAGNRLIWSTLREDGTGVPQQLMYHHSADGWALQWPENWPSDVNSSIRVEHKQENNVSTTSFYMWLVDHKEDTEVLKKWVMLTVWSFRGEDRERARNQQLQVKHLNESGEVLYGYTLPGEQLSDEYYLTEQQVEKLFLQVKGSLEGDRS